MHLSKLQPILEQELHSAEQGIHTPVMLWGPPGVGKSRIVAELAQQHDTPMIDLRLSQIEPSDLRGIPYRRGEGVEWAIPNMLPNEERHGNKGILFLDEINAAPPSVSAAAYQLILDRRLGDYKVPPGWAIFAAGNRQGDRGVSHVMPTPLANRFTHYEIEVNLDDWVSWAMREGINENVIGFLRFRPELLFEFDQAENPIAFPSPRTWEFADRALQKFSDNPDALSAALEACVGEAAGVEFMAYLQHLERLPDIDAILQGQTVEIPNEVDLQYAVASALTRRAKKYDVEKPADRLSLENILNFATRFPQREIGVMLVSDLHRILEGELFKLEGFTHWAEETAGLMVD
ncbi:MAG: MoxR family ATPase [Gammaproteobacteria bacterium]|nr:MoxR family ATPase [Gammaproteobacteria bacterium]